MEDEIQNISELKEVLLSILVYDFELRAELKQK